MGHGPCLQRLSRPRPLISSPGAMTGNGPVAVRQPRVRNRGAGAAATYGIRFTPTILPPYATPIEEPEGANLDAPLEVYFHRRLRRGCGGPDGQRCTRFVGVDHLPDEEGLGRRYLARFLRIPRRTLEAPQNVEPHREHIRDRPSSHHPIEGLSVEDYRARHGRQAGRRSTEKLAPARSDTTSCPRSCWVRSSRMGWRFRKPSTISPRPPPELSGRHQDLAIAPGSRTTCEYPSDQPNRDKQPRRFVIDSKSGNPVEPLSGGQLPAHHQPFNQSPLDSRHSRGKRLACNAQREYLQHHRRCVHNARWPYLRRLLGAPNAPNQKGWVEHFRHIAE